jgi:threonine dehydratase
MGIRATIVMPRFASSVKVENTRGFGAEVVLVGRHLRGRSRLRPQARRRARHDGRPSVRRPRVIAGQGTVALEMLAQQPRSTRSSSRSAAAA